MAAASGRSSQFGERRSMIMTAWAAGAAGGEMDHRHRFVHRGTGTRTLLMGGVKFCLLWSGCDGASAYIVCMDTILPILLGPAMLVTLGVLCAGVIAFAFNTKRQRQVFEQADDGPCRLSGSRGGHFRRDGVVAHHMSSANRSRYGDALPHLYPRRR